VATAASLVDHVMEAPVITVPFASRAVAVRVVDQATFTVAVDGDTAIVAIGPGAAGVTDTLADPATPSIVAVIVAVPLATPVTRPDDETVATPGVPLVHETVRPVRG
jgi:hypothetical protein